MLYIPTLEGKYSITSDGEIYSHKRKGSDGRLITGRWIKPSLDKDGYKRVTLCYSGRGTQKSFRICRLVASTYLIPDNTKPHVNHKNGIKTDDRVDNLEWIAPAENTKHAWNLGLCKPYDRTKPYNRDGIIQSNKNRKRCGI